MKFISLIIIIFLYSPVNASLEDLQAKLIDQILVSSWSEYQEKLILLRSNYIPKISPSRQYFVAAGGGPSPCTQFGSVNPEQVASLSFQTRKVSKRTSQMVIVHKACLGSPYLKEIIEVTGRKAKLPSAQSIFLGFREFSLKSNETSKFIRWESVDKKNILKFFSKREKGRLVTKISVADNLTLTFILTKNAKKNETVLLIKHQDITINYSLPVSRGRVVYEFTGIEGLELIVRQKKGQDQLLYSYRSRGRVIDQSEDSFNQIFQNYSFSPTSEILKQILASISLDLPTLKSSNSAGLSGRFVEELNLYLRRLQSGSPSDVDFVREKLRQLLESIDKGEFRVGDQRSQ